MVCLDIILSLLFGNGLPSNDKTWACSLAHGLLLPEDVHAFEEGTEESMGRRLQWHTIVVIFHLLISY